MKKMQEKKEDFVGKGRRCLDSLAGQTWLCILFMIGILCSAGVAAIPLVELHRYDSYKMMFYVGGIGFSSLLFIGSIAVKNIKYSHFGKLTFFTLLSFVVPGTLLMTQVLFNIDRFIPPFFEKILLYVFFGFLLTSFLLSIFGLFWRRGKTNFLVSLAVFMLFTSQIGLPMLFKQVSYCYHRKHPDCRVIIRTLSKAYIYSYTIGEIIEYPNRWCDYLHQEWDVELKGFLCPDAFYGPCSYAMNENIPADANEMPGDLVLLFESSPGWNQTGGADEVVTDRHKRPGANIAFADGHVEFVKSEAIPNLRWTLEEQ